MRVSHLKRKFLRIPQTFVVREPRAALTIMCRTSEFSSSDLHRILTQISPFNADNALRDIRGGRRPLLGTLLSLLSEVGQDNDSDSFFVIRAHEKLLEKPPEGEGLHKMEQALASGFLSRAEVIQNIIDSSEFQIRYGRSHRVSGTLGLSEALLIDRVQRMLHPRRLLPPATMRWKVGQQSSDVYGRNFELIGRHFQAKLVRDAGLKAVSRVLDIGSGCGRIAIPLTEVVGPSGLYIGLETDPEMVTWCERNISTRFSQFRFIHCAVQNSAYNPKGSLRAEEYKFPLDSGQFDVAIATSVLTHLRPASAENYILECARVMKPGGSLFATAFLIENGSHSADWKLKFDHRLDDVAFTSDPNVPEAAVAYPTEWLLDNFRGTNLELIAIHNGSWSGIQPAYSGQDVLILSKKI